MAAETSRIPEILSKYESDLASDWLREMDFDKGRERRISEADLRSQALEFIRQLMQALRSGNIHDINGSEWKPVRDMLDDVSRARVQQGFSSDETATFIFSFKQPLFTRLRKEVGADAQRLADETWVATQLLDKLGLHTFRAYQKTREEVINRQQQELLELSTPVVKLWDGVLALPMIGTLDSARTQIVMETLLQRIVETGASIAIIDITGVPTVDTMTAQHLLKTVTATRLMGAECIISGIRPQIAQTIVHLGVDLGDVATKATLADAFRVALSRTGRTVCKITKDTE